MSNPAYAQVTVAALPVGSGVFTREVSIGDGHPTVLIELELLSTEDEPAINLKVTAGGLGFSEYRGALAAISEILRGALTGLGSPHIDVSDKYLLPNEDPHA